MFLASTRAALSPGTQPPARRTPTRPYLTRIWALMSSFASAADSAWAAP